ncbi:MAG: hypothetical protein IH971_08790 [Candidatus Marinimicrobia bacterium]|nr:hypothetical protein [Candidatus Neomarinimicrobiota bacterium]
MAKKEQLPIEVRPVTLLKRTIDNLGEAISGAGREIKDKGLIQAAGNLVQRYRAHGLLGALSEELDVLIETGKIDSKYLESPQYMDCLQELLEFLDNDIPDPTRFDALKAVFLVAASEEASKREDILPYQYMRLCKSMTSGEILVMLTEYQLVQTHPPEGFFPHSTSVNGWRGGIANSAGLGHAEMVGIFDEKLVQKNILHPRGPQDESLTTITQNGRLTDLGWGLCKFIAQYENDMSTDEVE